MTAHPRRAARDPLKGATLAARQSRFRSVLAPNFPSSSQMRFYRF